MTRYARIQDGEVTAVRWFERDPATYFPSAWWVAAPEEVAPGWRYDGDSGGFQPPPGPDLATRAEGVAARVDRAHAEVLRHGLVYLGVRWVATDRASRDMAEIDRLVQGFDAGETVTLLDAEGGEHELTKAEFEALRDKGLHFRDQARKRRLDLHRQVQTAGTIEDLDAIDVESGWPE